MSEEARVKATVYVSGLDPINTTTDAVYSFFLPFGEIVDVVLPGDRSKYHQQQQEQAAINPQQPRNRGFAYVEYSDPLDAAAAIDNADQAELFGRTLKVSQAKNLARGSGDGARNEGLGAKTAVWEQEAWLKKYEVAEEDREAVEKAAGSSGGGGSGPDPMEGLEGLDVAGPKPVGR